MNILIHISSSWLINQFLILAIVVFDSKREKHSLYIIWAFLFFTKYQMWGCQIYIFIMEKCFNSPGHDAEQNWSISFKIIWKGKWKPVEECLYFSFVSTQYIAGSYCIKIKYIFTIIKGSFFSPLMKINNNLR